MEEMSEKNFTLHKYKIHYGLARLGGHSQVER